MIVSVGMSVGMVMVVVLVLVLSMAVPVIGWAVAGSWVRHVDGWVSWWLWMVRYGLDGKISEEEKKTDVSRGKRKRVRAMKRRIKSGKTLVFIIDSTHCHIK
jgi:uncharacterized protein (DUF697 family)